MTTLKGGPYSGAKVTPLETGGSLPFCASGQCGHYSGDGQWIPAPVQGPDKARALGYRVEVEPTVLNGGDRTTSGAIGQP